MKYKKRFQWFFNFWFILFISPLATLYGSNSITVLGTGYAGLVTGVCFSEFGNKVICADIDTAKIKRLKKLSIPIYEPGLEKMVERNVAEGRLAFTTDINAAIQQSDIVFIAVGTPMKKDGTADLSYLYGAIEMVADQLTSYKTIVIKSTVPVGTNESIQKLLKEDYNIDPSNFALVSCPEFLREGKAVEDFLNPDRIVVGTDSESAKQTMLEIHYPLKEQGVPFVFTKPTAAEVIKYGSNSFRAVKLSFINEIANFCDAVGVDIYEVGYALGIDKMIGANFFKPGPGFGGSCLPKDTQEMVFNAHARGVELRTIKAAIKTNELQQQKPFEKLYDVMNGNLQGKTIAILGLAFKAETDDIRCSAAIKVIELLKKHGVNIRAYDPVAMFNMQKIHADITYCADAYQAALQADAIVLLTEWEEFKELDYQKIAENMNQRIIIDARNMLDVEELKRFEFKYDGIGRSSLLN